MKRTIITTVLLGLISAVSTYFLFRQVEGFKEEIREHKKAVMEMKDQVSAIENKYKLDIQYWAQKNNALRERIVKTDTALSQSRDKASVLEKRIKGLMIRAKTFTVTPQAADNQDSIEQSVTQFIEGANGRDSLCREEITDLKQLVQNKDSALTDCQKSFLEMKGTMESSFQLQSKLIDQLAVADKKMKRSRLGTKLASAGAMILSGVTAVLILKK